MWGEKKKKKKKKKKKTLNFFKKIKNKQTHNTTQNERENEENIKNIKLLKTKFKNKNHEIVRGDVYSLVPKLDEKFNIIFCRSSIRTRRIYKACQIIIRFNYF